MAELAELFIEGLSGRIGAMRNAWRSGDLAQVRFGAHQLRGAAGGYGFPEIGDAAGCLEDLLRGSAGNQSCEGDSDTVLEDVLMAIEALERRHEVILANRFLEDESR